ncbi:MAG: RNA chaperone Hfq [Rhodospirillaceae bacterium]
MLASPAANLQLQDEFLDELRKTKATVSMFLVNGIRLIGKIEGYDRHVVLLANGTQQLVYKHAISTIVPGEPRPASERPSGPTHGEGRHSRRMF